MYLADAFIQRYYVALYHYTALTTELQEIFCVCVLYSRRFLTTFFLKAYIFTSTDGFTVDSIYEVFIHIELLGRK